MNHFQRYQKGLILNDIFPSLDGVCACGCENKLPSRRKKWFSDNCRDLSFIKFAIRKGDTSVIRYQLFKIDQGACRLCGCITENWQADHIIPVSHGGATIGLSNFQTLCLECHKEKTAKTAAGVVKVKNIIEPKQKQL